jgi:hypothetical protein
MAYTLEGSLVIVISVTPTIEIAFGKVEVRCSLSSSKISILFRISRNYANKA